jgi:hypothetical protein
MPTVSLQCPHCGQLHAQAVGINDEFVITPVGREFECPFCKKPFMVATLFPVVTPEQADTALASVLPEMNQSVITLDPRD